MSPSRDISLHLITSNLVVFAMSASVPHNLEAAYHLANTKEADGFRSDDAYSKERIGVEVSYSAEKTLLGVQANILSSGCKRRRIADCVCKRC